MPIFFYLSSKEDYAKTHLFPSIFLLYLYFVLFQIFKQRVIFNYILTDAGRGGEGGGGGGGEGEEEAGEGAGEHGQHQLQTQADYHATSLKGLSQENGLLCLRVIE
jgi:hypothetical protein